MPPVPEASASPILGIPTPTNKGTPPLHHALKTAPSPIPNILILPVKIVKEDVLSNPAPLQDTKSALLALTDRQSSQLITIYMHLLEEMAAMIGATALVFQLELLSG